MQFPAVISPAENMATGSNNFPLPSYTETDYMYRVRAHLAHTFGGAYKP